MSLPDIHAEINAMAVQLSQIEPSQRPALPQLDAVTLPMLALQIECIKIKLDELEQRISALEN
jgi:hypothetical protein